MNRENAIFAGALSAAVAVGIGAFGAHGLAALLEELGRTATFETAVKYHFYHSLGLIALGLVQKNYPEFSFRWSGVFFLAGILFFCGSLYTLSLTGITFLGAVAPIGGLCFILAWLSMAWGIKKAAR